MVYCNKKILCSCEGGRVLQKRYISIIAASSIAIVFAIVGFFMPAEEVQKVPVRLLLDNPGGAVVFDHKVHVEKYDLSCEVCHHELAPTPASNIADVEVLDCGACHGVNFDEKFIAEHQDLENGPFSNTMQCATCHHIEFTKTDWGHDMHSEDMMLDCTSCHHEDTDIEPEPQNCANCHFTGYLPADDPMPSLKNAVHTRCMDCHQDYYDEGLNGCASCHYDEPTQNIIEKNPDFEFNADQMTCMACHEDLPANELIPGRMDAFHNSCTSCHVEVKKGPTVDDCAQCHT